jgi:N6-L-threonylcarbamoyladenine synthase
LLGETRDDAAGEAFDKVASMLGLGFPGGPAIERLAATGRDRFGFPRPMLHDGFDFSFSGLKTAVLLAVRGSTNLDGDRADLAASFQAAVLDVLATKVSAAIEHTGYRTALLGGGVACNRALTQRVAAELKPVRARVAVASPRLNADNAAMIARAGWFHLSRGEVSDHYLDADPRLPWPGLETGNPALSARPARSGETE